MVDPRPINSCQRCGGTAYKPIFLRNNAGVVAPTGQYKCVQCGVVFTNIHQWRGDPDSSASLHPTSPREVE